MGQSTKAELFAELIALLESDLSTAARAQENTQAGVTHEDAKPENDKDTRALEQSYLARGQAVRVEELRLGLGQTRSVANKAYAEDAPIGLGALVVVEEEDRELTLLIAPARGGTKLANGAQVVTPGSPLGRAILGQTAGSDCDVVVAKGKRSLTIVSVE